jgi:hypothetical protein
MRRDLVAALVLIALAGSFLLGRKFPSHHYQTWGNTLLYDTATGKVCDPIKRFKEEVAQAKASNPIDNALAGNSIDPNSPLVQRAARIAEQLNAEKLETHIPPCD